MTCARREAGARRPAPSTSADSPRRPEPRRGRFGARLSLLLPALALLLGALSLFHAAPAAAQSALVSNIGQADESNHQRRQQPGFTVVAQGFTTGSNTDGYTLTSIQAVLSTFTQAVPDFTNLKVELWSDSSGNPGTKIADLTKPTSYSAGTLTFTAPSNTALDASTTYHVVFYVNPRSSSPGGIVLHTTASTAEDSGGAAGWSIANTGRNIRNANSVSGTWANYPGSRSLRIRVNGVAVSTDATLSGLTASTSTSVSGTFTALTLSPETFAAATTEYTAAVANTMTHVKLTPAANHSGATVEVGKGTSLTAVTSGSASAAIPLDVGANAITVKVTAQDGTTTKTYTVTVTRRAPPEKVVFGYDLSPSFPFNLSVDEGVGTVRVPITVSALPVTSLTVAVSPQDVTTDSADHDFSAQKTVTFRSTDSSKTRFVEFSVTDDSAHEFTESLRLTLSIPSRDPSFITPYDIVSDTASGQAQAFVNIVDNDGPSSLTGNTYAITPSVTVAEGASATLTVTLGADAPTNGLAFTVTPSYCTCGPTQLTRGAVAADVGTVPSTVMVSAGSRTATLTIPIATDQLVESSEEFSVTIATATTGWTAAASGAATATVIITDVPAITGTITVSAPATVTEGQTIQITFTTSSATSSSATATDRQFRYSVTLGTAEAADIGNFQGSGTNTIPAGGTMRTVNIPNLHDTDQEDETFTVTVVNPPTGYTVGSPSSVTITIIDDDKPAPAAPTGLTVTPGDFSMSLSWTAPSGTVTGYDVHYTSALAATVANDAAVGSGYPPEQGWLDAVHSGTGTTHNLLHLDNGTPYRVRVRTVNANGNSAWVFGTGTPVAPSTPTVTTPTVSLSASPNPVVEGSSVIVTATLSAPAASALTIPVTVTAGTAESGDFGSLTTIAIAAGETKGRGTISTNHDAGENDETFTVSLGSTLPGGLLAGSPASVTVTIADDEGNVTVSFARATATLCEGGPRKNLPRLVLSRRPVQNYVAVWVTLDRGTAEWRDHSFAGQTPITIQWTRNSWFDTPLSIQALEDGDSAYEEFTVQIDESRMPRGFVAVSPKKVKVTIVDNDLWGQDGCDIQPARLTVKGERGVEGSGRRIDFTVSTDRNSPGPFTVDYRTEDVTARSDGTTAAGTKDYEPASGRLTFGPDERTKNVSVFLLDDDVEDSGETFRLVLHNPQGAVIEQGVGIGTILNHEQYVDATKLRAAFEQVPARSSGTEAFWFDLRFTEGLGETANAPSAASFAVTGGRIDRVWKVEAGLWRLRVEPEAWREVTVTLSGGRGCDAAGAVCTADGRALVNSPVATVASPERPLSSNADLSGLSAQAAGADGRWSALDFGAFRAGKTGFYSVTVPYGTTQARLTATAAHAGATLRAGAAGSLSAVSSGAAGPSIALDVGANALEVTVTAEDGTARTYRVTVTREAARPLTAAFENAPSEHDGGDPFAIDLRFSEALGGGGVAPSAASFRVQAGDVAGVERVSPRLWRVRARPKNWKDVTVTLSTPSDCAEAGAICTADGRALSNTVTATVGGPVRIRVEGARAKEGRDEALDFAVTLNRAASHEVSVDYATADDTATDGADYTATSGTLVFTAGETAKTVSVPVLDDAVDEGKETMHLHLSNPRGAYLRSIHRRARGIIVNDDPLQKMWLSRFGRTVGSHVTGAVSDRLSGGLTPGAHATLAGQGVDLSRTDDGKALADTLTGLAQRFGAQAPADDDPFARHGSGGGIGAPASTLSSSPASSPARSMTGRELLLGSSFHLANEGDGSGPGLAAWGRVAHGGFDGEEGSDGGRTRIDGEVLTGTLGADADFGRVLAGVAVSLSEGDGTFDSPGVDTGPSGGIESTMTTVSPYARLKFTERVSAWGLAGFGTGDMTIRFDDGAMDPIRTDVGLRMGALGARGALLEQDETGGMDLALKADAFFVRMDSEKAVNTAETTADASRMRLVLEGGRAFDMGGGATLRPSLELGVRHDGGDAETGTGVELGAGVAFTDAASGLGIEAKWRMLVAHADSDYEEWGASATARLDPGERGRGLSFSLAPTLGATSSASERLWAARDARALAPGGAAFEASRGLTAEAGYGLALFGDRFTGTPNVGFGLADAGARDYRIGWRLTSAVEGDPGFEVNLDAVRREAANDAEPEHGVMLRGEIRW